MTSVYAAFRKKRKSRLTENIATLYAGWIQSFSSMQTDDSELEDLFINRGMMSKPLELSIQENMTLNIPSQQEIN